MFSISFHLAHILAISIQENTCGTCYCRKVTLISTSKEILEAHLSLHGNKTNKSAPDMVPNAAGNSNMWASTGTRVLYSSTYVLSVWLQMAQGAKKEKQRSLGRFALCVKIRSCHSSAELVRSHWSNTEPQLLCIMGPLDVIR